MGRKIINLTGQIYGRLTAVREVGRDRRGAALWLCRCECGGETVVLGQNLRSGYTKSCGCLNREMAVTRNMTHGHSSGGKRSPEYHSWAHVIQRCTNPNHRHYKDYGGRGIKVCERWQSFENFLADMGPRPPGTTLDRIDVNGNYCPDNCRWATATQQNRNTRFNRLLTINLMTLCAAEWAELVGESRNKIHSRLYRGWSNLEAVFGRD